MWLKILLAVIIIAVATLCGYLAGNKFRARRKYYAQLAAFNERYLNELDYARKPLADFLKEFTYTGDFAKSLNTFSESRAAKVDFSYLDQEERMACADYFAMLGKGDSLSQRSYFSSKKAGIEEKRAASEKDAKSRCALYLKLGVLAGLAAVILIV